VPSGLQSPKPPPTHHHTASAIPIKPTPPTVTTQQPRFQLRDKFPPPPRNPHRPFSSVLVVLGPRFPILSFPPGRGDSPTFGSRQLLVWTSPPRLYVSFGGTDIKERTSKFHNKSNFLHVTRHPALYSRCCLFFFVGQAFSTPIILALATSTSLSPLSGPRHHFLFPLIHHHHNHKHHHQHLHSRLPLSSPSP